MTITKALITKNEYTRPGRALPVVLGIVMHWTANPAMGAMGNRDYFEYGAKGAIGYVGAHYIVDQAGGIVQCIPETEIAYHTGTSKVDPQSKRVYTDEARKRFKAYAENPTTTSPNFCTIGIELCPVDWEGRFSVYTLSAASELCADILKRHGLTESDITTHHDVVGWKDCPRLWTRDPDCLEDFRRRVRDILVKEFIA